MVPSGGVISSASEMAEWMKFHLGTHPSPPLTKASVELMHTPHTVIQRPTSWMTFEGPGAYAMGWATGRFDNVTTVGHAGAALGFNCSIAMVPQKRFGVFTTANRNSELPYVLTKWAVTQFFGGPEARARDWHDEHERNVRAGRTRHLPSKHLEIECPVIIFQMVNALSKYRATSQIGSSGEPVHLTFVPVDPHANAAL
mgnify:CR=1 FL=1